MDHTNQLRQGLERGDRVIGARAKTYSPMMIEVYGELGLDYVWLDFEHGGPSPYDSGQLEALTRAAEVAEIALLARLPSPDPALVRKVLDAGVRTVLIPRIETADEIREAIEAARFVYNGQPGERGFAGGRTNTYGAEMDDYVDREDRSVLVGAQIEHRRAVENLDEILSVPDLGFVIIGYGDLSISLGQPLRLESPDVREAIEMVRDRCMGAGVPVGYTVDDTDEALTALDQGFQLIRIGDEVSSVRQTIEPRLSVVREHSAGQ